MSAAPGSSDWIGARGAQWSAHLTGMEAMLAPVDEPLWQALRLDGPARIAEIGCGGGGTAIELLRRAPDGSVVHGFDVSSRLIAQARARTGSQSRALDFAVADMATAVSDAPYDRLISRFGVMFFDDPKAAFANLVRWLAPGGRFAFAVWGPPAENAWIARVRDVVSRFVSLPPAEPCAPGPFRYADPEPLRALLTHVGFVDVEAHDWRGALPIGGSLPPAEAARFALASFSSFGELLGRAGSDALEGAQRSLTTCFAEHARDGAVTLGARVWIVSGARR